MHAIKLEEIRVKVYTKCKLLVWIVHATLSIT